MKVFGTTKDLGPQARRAIERLYRRKCDPRSFITNELSKTLSHISHSTGKEIGLLLDRKGLVKKVLVGSPDNILIPDLSSMRRGPGRLKGLRCVHTHLRANKAGLDHEDLTDLALLRLDAMVAIHVGKDGRPGQVSVSHLLPPNPRGEKWHIFDFPNPASCQRILFPELVQGLEDEMQRAFGGKAIEGEERAILVYAGKAPMQEQERSMRELELLAQSAGIQVVETIFQRTHRYHPAHLIGLGKLREILMHGLYLGATMVVFHQELSPAQANKIARMVDLKVIDRTQLILDIFAKRAQSKEGKLQVELAQLRYLLPRLVGKGTAMSRLQGGIGGRGPGEKKLEVDRRRVKQRIHSLTRELETVSRRRGQRRKRRERQGLFKISLVGYTNAGKSTLLNAMTGSSVISEDKLFATLDPTTKRFFLEDPGVNILISDTVGFIRQMPQGLKTAFKSTLEELEWADLLVHVIDLESPSWIQDKEAVEAILAEMGLGDVPTVDCYNKVDTASAEVLKRVPKEGVLLSAKTGEGLKDLIQAIKGHLPRVLRQCTGTQGPLPYEDHIHSSNLVMQADS